MKLNKQQQQAAEFQTGIAVVIAVPGSGKTLTMTNRIGNLVKSGVAPENILGLTFTKNAAKAMRDRLAEILEDKASRVTLSTIHSFCYFLLRSEGKIFGILDGKERLIFMRKLMQELKIKDISVGMVLSEIGLAKNNLVSVDEFYDLYEGDSTMLKVADIYKAYEEAKSKKMLLDFEDLLTETYRLLSDNSDIRDKYRTTFKHLMVDEYQDTNPAQFEIIRLLTDNPGNGSSLWVCGDDSQSIYAFTGASIGNILNFKDLFPGSSEYMLNLNYRSTPQILNACQNLINHNLRKIDKVLKTENPDGDDIVVLESASEEEEALLIASEIKDLVEKRSYSYTDIAVLYRANFQSRYVEEVFSQQQVPYQVENGLHFYQRREVKLLLDYLTLIHSPYSEEGDMALTSIYNTPNRYLSRQFLHDLERYASGNGIHLYQAMKDMHFNVHFVRHNVREFIELIEPLIDDAPDMAPGEVIQQIREELDYDRYVTDDDIPSPDDQKIANINQLVMSASRYQDIGKFLDYTSTFRDETVSDDKNGIRLMTIHKSKGLEFPVVFVVGMLETILPSKKGNLEEERRICFVAISRAMKQLYLSHSTSHLGAPAKKSLFIDEILGRIQPLNANS